MAGAFVAKDQGFFERRNALQHASDTKGRLKAAYISSLPTAYGMNKDVKIDAFSYASVYLNDLVWSDYAGK